MKTTDYTRTVTLACPAAGIDDANHLALLLGESSADINTFRQPGCTKDGIEYATTHAAVKPVFLGPTQTGTLPETPPHAEGLVDREAAQRAFDSLNQPGGLLMAVDVDPHAQFTEWGLTPIITEEI
tara:strand:+ start:2252 stop:2629 length:378 start_codon:yes stop_codon:yes gene_type:complete